MVFGNQIYDAIESAPIRLRESSKTQTLQVTECVRTSFPRHNFQDAIICLDVGRARELAEILFPQPNGSIVLLSDKRTHVHTEATSGQQPILGTGSATGKLSIEVDIPLSYLSNSEDYACLSFSGASVSAIASLFHPQVCNAIEKSQLRSWEKEHSLPGRTDCVTMESSRIEPNHGTIRLRIEFLDGICIVKDLYAESVLSSTVIQSSTSL